MKTLIVILALIIIGCSSDNDETPGCECTGKFSTPETYPNYFYIDNVKIDCSTGNIKPNQNIQSNAIFCGCK